MSWFGYTLIDLRHDADRLRRARNGVIATHAGSLQSVHLRPWPKIGSALEIEWWGRRAHSQRPGDCCWLYYHQPRRCPNFLALKYVVSYRDASYATFHRALEVLDEIARLKRSDAIVCDVWNDRISDRLLARLGWEALTRRPWHRPFIKRFYGVYPATSLEVSTTCEPATTA